MPDWCRYPGESLFWVSHDNPEQNNYLFEILHFSTLFGSAMGIDYEDKYKKYMLSGSAKKVLQDAEKYIE